MKHRSYLLRLTAAALCVGLLSGCAIWKFETPEEQRAAQEAQEAKRAQVETAVDPASMQINDLSFSRELVNSQETVLAAYRVTLPRFSESGLKSQSFSRINRFFRNEYVGLDQDCQSFLEDAKTGFGENWDNIKEVSSRPGISVDYELLTAPVGYLTVCCRYSVWENSQNDNYSRCTVFLLDNGWELTLETLFGTNYEKAAPLLMADILEWCEANDVDVTQPERFSLSDFSEGYGLTTRGLLFYTQPFQLNTKDGSRYEITVPLGRYLSLLNGK